MSAPDETGGLEPARCPRCRDVVLEAEPLGGGVIVRVCGRCEGRLLEAAVRARFGAALEPDPDALADPFGPQVLGPCPDCGGALHRVPLHTTAGAAHGCDRCGAVFLDAVAFVAARDFEAPAASAVIDTVGLELELGAVRPVARDAVARGDVEALRGSLPAPPVTRAPRASVTPGPDAQRAAIEATAARTAELDEGLAFARLPVDEPRTAVFGPLLAWSLAALGAASGFTNLLVLPVQIQFHELGHALAAWAAGRAAVPLPCGITLVPETPSLGFTACSWSLLAVGAWTGHRRNRRALLVLCGGALALAVCVRLFASESLVARLVLQGGFYGELLLPALLAVLYHHDPIPRLRWDFVRLFALPVAAASMLRSLGVFVAALRDPSRLMGGTMLGGDDHGSDLERLVRDHGADPRAVLRRVLLVGACALLLVAGRHLAAARAARRAR